MHRSEPKRIKVFWFFFSKKSKSSLFENKEAKKLYSFAVSPAVLP